MNLSSVTFKSAFWQPNTLYSSKEIPAFSARRRQLRVIDIYVLQYQKLIFNKWDS